MDLCRFLAAVFVISSPFCGLFMLTGLTVEVDDFPYPSRPHPGGERIQLWKSARWGYIWRNDTTVRLDLGCQQGDSVEVRDARVRRRDRAPGGSGGGPGWPSAPSARATYGRESRTAQSADQDTRSGLGLLIAAARWLGGCALQRKKQAHRRAALGVGPTTFGDDSASSEGRTPRSSSRA